MAFEAKREAARLLAAVQFLTRIPVPALAPHDPDWLAGAARYFPLVGAGIGAFGAAILFGADRLWPAPIPALLAVAATILVTGGLHEDGLADLADSAGGANPEARLAIMKDSRLGAFGALALGLALAIEVAALAALPLAAAALAFVAAHAGGRAAALAVMWRARYAGDLDRAKAPHATGRPGPGGLAFGLAVAALPLVPLGWPAALAGLAFAALPVLLALRWSGRALGGYTGDVLGAAVVLWRAGFLLGAAAALR